ncbi:MAG: hypothetical protein ABIU54_09545, partial [Candidatus Eisenbacteria bacterium]
MRRSTALLFGLALLAAPVHAHHSETGAAKAAAHGAPPPYDSHGLGNTHHAVSTHQAEAQRLFDQGLALCYAFNHEEAVRSFERALKADPQLAMAQWGIAYALGPNINLPTDSARSVQAFNA